MSRQAVSRILAGALTLVALLLLLPEKASAYIDPGSGALLWQTTMASVIGLVFYFRRFLTRFFGGRKRDR